MFQNKGEAVSEKTSDFAEADLRMRMEHKTCVWKLHLSNLHNDNQLFRTCLLTVQELRMGKTLNNQEIKNLQVLVMQYEYITC